MTSYIIASSSLAVFWGSNESSVYALDGGVLTPSAAARSKTAMKAFTFPAMVVDPSSVILMIPSTAGNYTTVLEGEEVARIPTFVGECWCHFFCLLGSLMICLGCVAGLPTLWLDMPVVVGASEIGSVVAHLIHTGCIWLVIDAIEIPFTFCQ